MVQNQKSTGSNGYQNLLFPLSYLYATQGEGGSYSHLGTLVFDFQGYGSSGRVYKCPYYAPCDVKLVARWGSNSPELVWESINKVNFVDGTLDYVCIGVAHDDAIMSYQIGETRTQGDLLGHTGTYGYVTGDHVHMEVAKGKYAGVIQNSYGNYMLKNSYHMYNAMGVDSTTIVNGLGFNWRTFGDTPTPPTPPHPPEPPTPYPERTKKYPWFIQTRKKKNIK